MEYIEIEVPEEFSFEQCMVYLDRSDIECLHRIKEGAFYKLLKFEEEHVLIKLSMAEKKLKVTFMNQAPKGWVREQVAKYVWDMFEAICWAIIGQQINLRFAYTLKKRLVECYGEKMEYNDVAYFLFPTPQAISMLEVEDLKKLQFTTRKAEYIIGIANLFNDGIIKKEKLALEKDYNKLKNRLLSIFQRKVWVALKGIPYGLTLSYKEMAIKIGNEKATRAVGNANGKNIINIIIPCHRVIGSDQSLTGYGGGINRKQWLLKHEAENLGQ